MGKDVEVHEVTPEAAKRIAEIQLESTVATKNSLLDEHSASFRWLMASLLAINGTGLISMKDVMGSGGIWTVSAIGSFYIGLCAALSVAWLSQRSVQAMIAPLSDLVAHWTMAAATGGFSVESHRQIVARFDEAQRSMKKPRIAGFISISAFTVGLVFLSLAGQTAKSSKASQPSNMESANEKASTAIRSSKK
jgi:hypothetical protein